MEFQRQEYPALLTNLQPEQAVDILNDRVSLINKVNSDIADWLQERRRIEENYAAGLRKLARRPQQDGASALGIFQMPWQRIVSGTESLAQSHETLAAKIQSDVETPLRQFPTQNREMQSISTVQGNLASIARDFGTAQKKLDKDQTKAKSQGKLDEAGREWESQAPFVFEQLQALDETRINHLRDVLTQFQTHEVDQVERNRTSAESCLNALLNIETADEIKTFAARVAEGRANLPRRQSTATTNTGRPTSAVGPPPTPPPSRLTRDLSSQRMGSQSGQDTLTPLSQKKGSLGGLKRLGTVMGRRKDKAPPPVPSASEKRKEKGRSFVPFRRGDSSRSFQELETTGQDFSPVPSSQFSNDQYRQPIIEQIPSQRTEDSSAPPMVNGTGRALTPEISERDEPTGPQLQEPLQPQQQVPPPQELSAIPATPSYLSSTDAVSRAQEEASPTAEQDEPSRNLTIRDQPIQEDETANQQAMSNMASQLRMQAQSSGMNRLQGSVRGRRDVRNTMFIPSAPPIQDSPPAAEESRPSTGLASAAATLSSAALVSEGMSDHASPIKRSTPTAPILEETQPASASDTGSIHSSHSLAGLAQHAEVTEPGLNASIIETVNTWFTADGQVTRSFAIGEIALAYNPSTEPSTSEKIRLSDFQVLEKVAANPTFVTASLAASEDKAGEYTINLSSIRRLSPTVALKYQLHLQPENLGLYSPLLISPAWQCQDGMASVIVLYSLNPSFPNIGPDGITLRNVVVSVSLGPSATEDGSAAGPVKATSAMMKPMENVSFRRKAGSVVWKLGEVILTPDSVAVAAGAGAGAADQSGQQQQKLLVRFMTTPGVPRRGNVEVKFEIVGRTGSSVGVQRQQIRRPEHDPFADEARTSEETNLTGSGVEDWVDVPTVRKLGTGRYGAA